jgi:hypothetical protein
VRRRDTQTGSPSKEGEIHRQFLQVRGRDIHTGSSVERERYTDRFIR